MNTMHIGKPCFIIAEAGSNHNGSLEQARKLIEVAADAKADAVKFQKKMIMGEKDDIARISTKTFARMVGKISGEVYCHCWRQTGCYRPY